MKIKPIQNKVVIKPHCSEEQISQGGIITAVKGQERPISGTVLFVGQGRIADSGERIPMDLKEGDTVFYQPHFATPINLGGEKLIVLKEEDILISVEEEE